MIHLILDPKKISKSCDAVTSVQARTKWKHFESRRWFQALGALEFEKGIAGKENHHHHQNKNKHKHK